MIFNEGNPGREGLLSGSLVDANGDPAALTIPVASVPFATGGDLRAGRSRAICDPPAPAS